jgi:predicted GNAT family acetyltransferase
MNNLIELKFDSPSQGGFYIFEEGKQLAELEFSINGKSLTAYHTGVRPELEGQGIAGRLFNALVSYARDNEYKIVPTCSYVLAKLSKNHEEFADVWE